MQVSAIINFDNTILLSDLNFHTNKPNIQLNTIEPIIIKTNLGSPHA